MMPDLEVLLKTKMGLVSSGSLDADDFRKWLVEAMLDFESCDDEELTELAFSLELLGFEFQNGYRTPADYIEAISSLA